MRVLFLNPPFGFRRPEGLDAPMGIMYLGAVLKSRGHTCRLVDHVWALDGDWRRWEAALREGTDLVLVHTHIRFTDDSRNALRRLRSVRQDLPAMAFGPQASTEPGFLLNLGFDACIIGEPEEIVPEALDRLVRSGRERRSVADAFNHDPKPGFATAQHPNPGTAPRVDVERLPFPDWELADYGRYIRTTHNAVFMASRGMDREDAFNQPPLIYARSPTRRCSADRVMNELAELRRRFPGHYMLLFHDEVFTEDRDGVVDLCRRLREARLGVPFWCFTRSDLLDDELCRIMRGAGFVGLSLGIESGSDRILEMLERGMRVEQIERGFRAAQRAGILTLGSVMIGTPSLDPDEPDETGEEIKATVRLLNRLHPDILTVTFTTPLPGTALYDRCRDRLLAQNPSDFNVYHIWPGKYPVRLRSLTADDLAAYAALLRRTWRRGLGKTVWRTMKLAFQNAVFRGTLLDQVAKVARRKVLGGS